MAAVLGPLVDHFNRSVMLRRLVALADAVDRRNREHLKDPIALILQYIESRSAGEALKSAESLLRKALFQSDFEASPRGRITPIEPRIRSRLRSDLMRAFEALEGDGMQIGRFRSAAGAYAAFEHWHIVQFETQVMPLALTTLGPDDWHKIDSAIERYEASAPDTAHDGTGGSSSGIDLARKDGTEDNGTRHGAAWDDGGEQLFRAALYSARAALRGAKSQGEVASS